MNDQIGHNSGDTAARLKSFVARIEKLQEDKAAVQEDIKQVFSEAKSSGYDMKALREVLRWRKMDEARRNELRELTELYQSVLGDLIGTPPGDAAINNEVN